MTNIEEVEIYEEYLDYEEISNSPEADLVLINAVLNDSVLGISLGKASKRVPFINHIGFLSSYANGDILVLSGKSYETLLQSHNGSEFSIPGAQVVVLTRDKNLVQNEDIQVFHDLEDLIKNIQAARKLGKRVLVNAGPSLLKIFEDLATHCITLFTEDGYSKYKYLRGTPVSYQFKREFEQGTYVVFREPLRGVSKKPVSVSIRKFKRP